MNKLKNKLSLIFLLLLTTVSCTQKPTHQAYIKVNLGKLYYQTFGTGEPIIILHGGPGLLDQNYLLPQMLELAKHNTITLYDQRGSGKSLGSPLNDKTININQFVADLETLRKTLGYKKFTLIGHSWGGRLAMEYAIKHPEFLSRLILIDSSPATSKGQDAFAAAFAKQTQPIYTKIKPLFNYADFSKLSSAEMSTIYRTLFSVYVKNKADANKISLVLDKQSALSGFTVMKLMSSSSSPKNGFDLRQKLKKLTVPTLIIHGADDLIIPVWTAEEIKNAIPYAQLVVIKNCGHFPFIEQPAEFFDAIYNQQVLAHS